MRRLRRGQGFGDDEGGQAIVLVAIMFLTLVFALALVVNTAMLFVARREAQAVADSTALAGATSLYLDDTSAVAEAAALTAATAMGYPSSDVTVTMGADTVRVDVRTSVPSLLLSSWGFTTVQAHATASTKSGSEGLAIFALGSTRTALRVAAGGKIDLIEGTPGKGIRAQVNSNDATRAILNQDNSNRNVRWCFDNTDDPGGLPNCANYVTGAGPPGGTGAGATPACASNGNVSPCYGGNVVGGACCQPGDWPAWVAHNQDPAFARQDPYLTFSPPVPVSGDNWCRIEGYGGSVTCGVYTNANLPSCGTNVMLKPGLYTTSISGMSCSWKLQPGVYLFTGNSAGISNPGEMTVGGRAEAREANCGSSLPCGASPSPASDGVFMVFTYATYPFPATSEQQCAELHLAGGATWKLSAETEGTYRGFLVYYDSRLVTGTSTPVCRSPVISFGGNTTFNNAKGLIYAKYGTVELSGANPVARLSQIVADLIDVQNGYLILDVNIGVPTPRVRPRLTE